MQVDSGWGSCKRYYGQAAEKWSEVGVGKKGHRRRDVNIDDANRPRQPSVGLISRHQEKRHLVENHVVGVRKGEYRAEISREAHNGASSSDKVLESQSRTGELPSRSHSAKVPLRKNQLAESATIKVTKNKMEREHPGPDTISEATAFTHMNPAELSGPMDVIEKRTQDDRPAKVTTLPDRASGYKRLGRAGQGEDEVLSVEGSNAQQSLRSLRKVNSPSVKASSSSGTFSSSSGRDNIQEDVTIPSVFASARDSSLDAFTSITTAGEVQDKDDWGVLPITTRPAKPIHFMGLNKWGKFIAQSLVSSGTPVTLLMHRPLLMQTWHDEGQSIRLIRRGEIETTSGFSVESTAVLLGQTNSDRPVFKRFGVRREHTTEPPNTVIETLFIASNPGIMLSSLERVAHRIRPYSTICFCGSGLGIVEKVNQVIFPNPTERPNYMLASLSHKLEAGRGRFDVMEMDKGGQLICTKLPRNVESSFDKTALRIRRKDFSWHPTSKYLLEALLQAPNLNAYPLGHKTFHSKQLIAVAMHALIDSVSVAFDVKCEDLLYNYNISQYMEMVLTEISSIIRALPEVDTITNVENEFSVKKLQQRAVQIIKSRGDKYTEFLMEIKEGRPRTGMEFYTGYLLERARSMGIQCPVLKALMLLVEGKQQFYNRQAKNFIPFDFTKKCAIDEDEDDGRV